MSSLSVRSEAGLLTFWLPVCPSWWWSPQVWRWSGERLRSVSTSALPNAVAAVHLARNGRGEAALSTGLNSNTLNVAVGLLLPAIFIGLTHLSGQGFVIAGWYVGLTALTLVLAYAGRGLRPWSGWLIIGGYAAFVVTLLAIA